jgi:tRNA dimethylallyltransferase
MWKQGLEDEVRSLMAQGLASTRTASAAIGYRQMMDFLDGRITSEQAKEQIKASTRRYVRRQESWFARDQRITWFPANSSRLLDEVLMHIAKTKAALPKSTG